MRSSAAAVVSWWGRGRRVSDVVNDYPRLSGRPRLLPAHRARLCVRPARVRSVAGRRKGWPSMSVTTRGAAAVPGVLSFGVDAAGPPGRQRVFDPRRPQSGVRGDDDQPPAGRDLGVVLVSGDARPATRQAPCRAGGARPSDRAASVRAARSPAKPKQRSRLRVREPRRLPRGSGRRGVDSAGGQPPQRRIGRSPG